MVDATWPNAVSSANRITSTWMTDITNAIKAAGVAQLTHADRLDLSGAAQTDIPILHALTALTINSIIFLYFEASSADVGVAVKVGKETDDDYFASETSEVSKAQWYTKSVTLINSDLEAGDTLVVANAGGKTGTGEIIVIVNYSEA